MPSLMPPEAANLARPFIEASIERSNPSGNTVGEVLSAIYGGEARLWMGNGSAAVTQFLQDAVVKLDERVWHAGGDLHDLMDVLNFGALACRQVGCDRLIIEETRPGWSRVLKQHGFREVTFLVRDL